MKKKILLISFVSILATVAVFYIVIAYSYSTGSRSGRLVKLSRKGLMLKEWEGTLDLGSGDTLTWNFSMRDDHMGTLLAKAIGEQVTLYYREHLFGLIYETKYNVYTWRRTDLQTAKLCPFLYLLRKDPPLQQQAARLIQKERPDLKDQLSSCSERLGLAL